MPLFLAFCSLYTLNLNFDRLVFFPAMPIHSGQLCGYIYRPHASGVGCGLPSRRRLPGFMLDVRGGSISSSKGAKSPSIAFFSHSSAVRFDPCLAILLILTLNCTHYAFYRAWGNERIHAYFDRIDDSF